MPMARMPRIRVISPLQYIADANAYRAMTLRVVYALDEFVWEAPAGRQNTIVGAMTVQETMQMADEVVVPNKIIV